MSNITTVSASGLNPANTLKQCEETVANLKELAKQLNEAQRGSSSAGQRDRCPEQRDARVDIGNERDVFSTGRCFVEESICQ